MAPHRMDLGRLLAALAAVAALHFGQALLMPFAVAMLIAFSLAPLVTRVERSGAGRVLAVTLVALLVVCAFGAIGWVVTRQASALAKDVPRYRAIALEKVRELREPIGSISDAAEEMTKLGETIEPGAVAKAPRVAVVEEQGTLETAGALLAPLLGPLGTIGLVAMLALFMLIERESLRDRMIWLIGASDLSVTTRALDEATQRVSRYLGMQSLINGMQGVAVTLGLLAIGVQGAMLWGALSAVLRFLPYFGPWIAAALPIALSVVTFHGWTEPLLTVALFVGLELVSNNILEPWLYGASVGLSPFGVVFSAIFWATVWGVPGLLVATPLTVCLVVAGRYARGFEIFAVLLGDQPALPPDVRLYQRLLAFDFGEAADILRDAAESAEDDELSDRVVLPVLRRLAEDDGRDAFPDATTSAVRAGLAELLEGLAPEGRDTAAQGPRARVLFVPALDDCDALAGRWLAQVTAARGIDAAFASAHALASELVDRVRDERPAAVCISALTPRGVAQGRLLCKRLAQAGLACSRILGCWAAPPHERAEPGRGDGTAVVATARELGALLQSARTRASGEPATRPD